MMCVASGALDLVGTGPGNTEITNGDPGQFVKPHSMRKIDTSQICPGYATLEEAR